MQFTSAIRWDAVREEAVRHLRELVRIDSSNPPGNERPVAEYLAKVLLAEGIQPLVIESAPYRANVYARLKGSGMQSPLMLMSHLDVVPADAAEWTYPPFSATLADGRIWGRGTIDTKKTTVAHLMTLLLIRRFSLPIRGDVVLLATADEESDFAYGASWLLRHRRDLFDATRVLHEGGEERSICGRRYCLVGTAEKGWCTIDVRSRGTGGHSSLPVRDNAILHMRKFLNGLAETDLPVHLVDTVRVFFELLAEDFQPEHATMASTFARLADPETADRTLRDTGLEEELRIQFNALLRNTVAPTQVSGGNSRWALPSEAHLILNGRLLPGQAAEVFEDQLRHLLGPEADFRIDDLHAGVECRPDPELFAAIRRVMSRMSPGTPVVPAMFTGGTERGLLHDIGVNVYGFCPMRDEAGQPPFMRLAHAPDERISVDNVLFSTRSVAEVVFELNGLGT